MELYITLGIIVIGVFLFVKEYFSIDTTSLLIMGLFIVTGVLNPEQGFSGFVHPATITLACMFVLSAGVFNTGIIDGLSDKLMQLAKVSYSVALVVFCVSTAIFSAFVNDTAVVAIMIPISLEVCRETGINPSKLLIPISFSACFGGACTLIGTGNNILVSSSAEQLGSEGFGMFEFAGAGVVLALIGFVYVFFISPWLLPKSKTDTTQSLEKQAEPYTASVTLTEEAQDVGKTMVKSKLVETYKVQIIGITRDSRNFYEDQLRSQMKLRVGDQIKILISPNNLTKLKNEKGYELSGDESIREHRLFDQETQEQGNLKEEEEVRKVYEVMIPFGSEIAGRTLKDLNFRQIYKSSVLAIRHRSETRMQELSEINLREGDMMLLHSSKREMSSLTDKELVVTLSEHESRTVDYKKAIPAVLILVGVIAAASLNLTTILMAGMIGCLLMVTLSILKPNDAYKAIDWKVIFMMAGVLSMGKALETTGGSDLISVSVYNTMGDLDPRITLSLIFLVTFLSTNILSSRAAAALMTPVVISLANALEVSDRPFLVAVMFACAFTFMTPVCNPTNTMVYAPGNYRFNDYLKVGTPLNIIIWIAASFVIPLFFPF